jgi:hypothetical protein
MHIDEPGGDRTSPRGRPSAFTPELALRVRKLLAEGWPVTSICAGIGIDRSTLYRWRSEHPEDFCNTSAGILPLDKKGAETADFTPLTPAPGSDPPPEDPVHGDVVLVVSASRKPPPISRFRFLQHGSFGASTRAHAREADPRAESTS